MELKAWAECIQALVIVIRSDTGKTIFFGSTPKPISRAWEYIRAPCLLHYDANQKHYQWLKPPAEADWERIIADLKNREMLQPNDGISDMDGGSFNSHLYQTWEPWNLSSQDSPDAKNNKPGELKTAAQKYLDEESLAPSEKVLSTELIEIIKTGPKTVTLNTQAGQISIEEDRLNGTPARGEKSNNLRTR